jgi:hypothetical protein
MARTLTRRAFLIQAGISLTAASRPYAQTLAEGGPPLPEQRVAASTLIGYGLVNAWFRVDAADFAARLANSGLTLTEIEYNAGRVETAPETHVERARKFVEAMRLRYITTLISVVNWNGPARGQPTPWFRDRVEEIARHIGSERVLLLPVSEPDASGKAVEWTRVAYGLWPGAKVGNGPGGRGTPVVSGYDYLDWHWCEDFTGSSVLTGPTINNTDCGPVLNPGPARSARMTRAAIDRHAHFLVYDHRGLRADEVVIAAIGAELQR